MLQMLIIRATEDGIDVGSESSATNDGSIDLAGTTGRHAFLGTTAYRTRNAGAKQPCGFGNSPFPGS